MPNVGPTSVSSAAIIQLDGSSDFKVTRIGMRDGAKIDSLINDDTVNIVYISFDPSVPVDTTGVGGDKKAYVKPLETIRLPRSAKIFLLNPGSGKSAKVRLIEGP